MKRLLLEFMDDLPNDEDKDAAVTKSGNHKRGGNSTDLYDSLFCAHCF